MPEISRQTNCSFSSNPGTSSVLNWGRGPASPYPRTPENWSEETRIKKVSFVFKTPREVPASNLKFNRYFVYSALTLKEEAINDRSEERRVGKECRYRWSPYHEKTKNK